MLSKILQEIGLTDKEAKVYLKLLELGSQPISVISKHTSINRSTCYVVIKDLMKKGIVSKFEKFKVQYFSAASPNMLIGFLKNQKVQIENKLEILDNNLEELNKIEDTQNTKTKVLFYEGFEGIKQIYEDTLKADKEILAFAGLNNLPKRLRDYINNDYLPRRVLKNIHLNAISTKKVDYDYDKNDKLHLREKKFVSAEIPFQIEINIYRNRVAFISYKDNNFSGVIIESSEINSTIKSLHKILWNTLPKTE